MHKILVSLLLCVLVTPSGVCAQTEPTNDGRDGTTRRSAIRLPAGFLREAMNRESVRLAALPSTARQQPPPRERGWPGRHPVLFGALVGLGTGLAVEAVVIPGESGGEPHSAYIPMFGSLGAGIGSLVGLIVSAARR